MDTVGGRSNKRSKERGGKKSSASQSREASKAGVIDEMIQHFEKSFDTGTVKMSFTDYLKLVQFREELRKEEPKEIKVTWVEPTEKESTTGT
jgi:hypothetical protein